MDALTNLTMEAPRGGNGFVFTANGSVRWEPRGIDVDFRVHLDDNGRLYFTKLSFDAHEQRDEVNATVIAGFPLADLSLAVRLWVTSGARPNGVMASMFRRRGEDVPGEAEWLAIRDRSAELLTDPSSRDGGTVGRPPTSPEELRRTAELYVRAFRRGDRAPKQSVAKALGLTDPSRRIDHARDQGWLARPMGRGRRKEIAPGSLLLAAWEAEGFPAWWTENDNERDNERDNP